MKQLRLKLKAAKGRVPKVLNEIERAVENFGRYEKGIGSSKRLNATTKEIMLATVCL